MRNPDERPWKLIVSMRVAGDFSEWEDPHRAEGPMSEVPRQDPLVAGVGKATLAPSFAGLGDFVALISKGIRQSLSMLTQSVASDRGGSDGVADERIWRPFRAAALQGLPRPPTYGGYPGSVPPPAKELWRIRSATRCFRGRSILPTGRIDINRKIAAPFKSSF